MSDGKEDAIDLLRELAELATLDEGDPQSFRVRAYESARHGIEGHAGDLRGLSLAELQKISGVGKSTAAKLRELFDTGRVDKLEVLRKKHPASVVALMRIPGLGPKAITRLRAELGIQSIDDLKKAIGDHKLQELRGFGKKSEEKLASVLERLAKDGGDRRTPISVALPVAHKILAELRAVPGVHRAEYCGSLRRFSETVGDLDIVVATDAPALLMEKLVSLPVFDHVLVRGDKKTSAVTRRGLQVDVRAVKLSEIGAALLYFTGSKGHNIKLRQRALDRGMTLNEYALAEVEGGRVVACETEEAIYKALDLPWIAPVLREDAGEIELAERGALPELIPASSMIGDFHMHTDLSGDGRSSLEEMVGAARARGYRVLAITEHAEGLAMQGVKRDALLEQRARIHAMQRELGETFRLLHGIELNIGPAGELDYDEAFRASFDFCLASVHDHFDLDEAKQTRRIVVAMEDPTVDMIGHLSARMIGGRPPIELDVGAVLEAAVRTGTALEINGALPRLDVSADVIRRARGSNVTFVITSDAHHTSELDRMDNGRMLAHKAWLPRERTANAWPVEQFLAWLGARRSRSKKALGSV